MLFACWHQTGVASVAAGFSLSTRQTGDSALICSRNFKHTNYNLGKHDSQKQSAKSTSAPATTSVTASATTEFRFTGRVVVSVSVSRLTNVSSRSRDSANTIKDKNVQ